MTDTQKPTLKDAMSFVGTIDKDSDQSRIDEAISLVAAGAFPNNVVHSFAKQFVDRRGGTITAWRKDIEAAAKKSAVADTAFNVQEWNARVGYIANGSGMFVMLDGDRPVFHQSEAFRGLTKDRYDIDPQKYERIYHVDMFMSDPLARKYSGVTFAPNKPDSWDIDPEGTAANRARGVEVPFNTWRKWTIPPSLEPIDRAQCELVRKHNFLKLCNGDLEVYRDHTMLLAHQIQTCGDTSRKLPIATVVPGDEGLGKSVFFSRVIGAAYEPYFTKVSQPNQVTGEFNKHAAESTYFVSEEAFFPDDPSLIGPIKDLISSETLRVRPMRQESYPVPNFLSLVFLSNNERPAPVNSKSRRFFVLPTWGVPIPPDSYFEPLMKEINGDGPKAHADYLLRWQPTREEFDRMLADAQRWTLEATGSGLSKPEGWQEQPEDWTRLQRIGREGAARNQMIARKLPQFQQFMLQWVSGNYGCCAAKGAEYLGKEITTEWGRYREDLDPRVKTQATEATPIAVGLALKEMVGGVFRKHERDDGNAWCIPERSEAVAILAQSNPVFAVYLKQLDVDVKSNPFTDEAAGIKGKPLPPHLDLVWSNRVTDAAVVDEFRKWGFPLVRTVSGDGGKE